MDLDLGTWDTDNDNNKVIKTSDRKLVYTKDQDGFYKIKLPFQGMSMKFTP